MGRVRDVLRGAVSWTRDVLRAPMMPTGPGGGYYGWSYGTPSQEKDWGTFADYAIGGYGGNSVVFGLIRTRMSAFSEARFKFRALADKKLSGDPALAPVERPWPGATTGELLARMELDVSLAGNAYVRLAGDRLERLRPDWVTIISEIERDEFDREIRTVVGYLYEPHGDPDRGIEIYDVDEVAHWSPIPDALANFRGMSWLTPVVKEVTADSAMTTHRDAYFRNAASPNLILKYAHKLNQAQVDRIADQVNARHGGAENAFRTMVLDVGADPMIVGTALSDKTFSLVQAAGETRIAAAAGVPPIVAGLKEGLAAGTHSNYGQAVRQFADMLLRPNWRGACAALAKLVEVPDGQELWIDTSDVALLQEGEAEQAATFQVKATTASTLIQAGYEWQSVTTAIEAGDMTLLKHTGLVSVQMHDANNPGEPKAANETPPAAKRSISRRYDPSQPRAVDGTWSDGPAGDVLRLANRIDLPAGQQLVGSARSEAREGDYGQDVTMALVSTPQGPELRLGIVAAGDAMRWRASNRGSTARLDAAATENLRRELKRAVAVGRDGTRRFLADESIEPDAELDVSAVRADWGDLATRVRHDGLGDGGWVVDVAVRPPGSPMAWTTTDPPEHTVATFSPKELRRLSGQLDRLVSQEAS